MNEGLKRIWLYSLYLKLILSALIPLSADESYYWVWGKNLQLSYYDHPGMVSWLFAVGTVFDNFGHAARWPAVVLGHFNLFFWIKTLSLIGFEDKKIIWFTILVLFSPMLGLGSIIITPDLPVLFFWSTSIYFILSYLKKPSGMDALLLGASLGLGFCSKYHMVLFLPFVFAFLIIEKFWKQISIKHGFIVVVSGFIFSLPVLIWNYQNSFSSFLFQINHGLGGKSWDPYWTLTYPVGQIILIFPVIIWFALKSKLELEKKILYYFAWGPLGFFFLTSFKGLVEMNWPIMGYHAIYALAVVSIPNLGLIKKTIYSWILIYVVVFSHAFFNWIPHAPAKLNELTYFKPLLEIKDKYSPLFAENYQMASYLWYNSKMPIFKLREMSRIDFYDSLDGSLPKTKIFYLAMDKDAGLPEWIKDKISREFDVELIQDRFLIKRIELL